MAKKKEKWNKPEVVKFADDFIAEFGADNCERLAISMLQKIRPDGKEWRGAAARRDQADMANISSAPPDIGNRAADPWSINPELRAEFGDNKKVYDAYQEAARNGWIKNTNDQQEAN